MKATSSSQITLNVSSTPTGASPIKIPATWETTMYANYCIHDNKPTHTRGWREIDLNSTTWYGGWRCGPCDNSHDCQLLHRHGNTQGPERGTTVIATANWILGDNVYSCTSVTWKNRFNQVIIDHNSDSLHPISLRAGGSKFIKSRGHRWYSRGQQIHQAKGSGGVSPRKILNEMARAIVLTSSEEP
jgi:hypothetical protein